MTEVLFTPDEETSLALRLEQYDPGNEVQLGEGFLHVRDTGQITFQGRHIGTSVQVFRALDALRLWIVCQEGRAPTPSMPGFAEVYHDEIDGLTAEMIFLAEAGDLTLFGKPAVENGIRLILTEAGAFWSNDPAVAADAPDPVEEGGECEPSWLSDSDLFAALESWALITQN